MKKLIILFFLSIPVTSFTIDITPDTDYSSVSSETTEEILSDDSIVSEPEIVADLGTIINNTCQYHDPKRNCNYSTSLSVSAHTTYVSAQKSHTKKIKESKEIIIKKPIETITKKGLVYNPHTTTDILAKLNIPASPNGYYLRIEATKPLNNGFDFVIIAGFGKNNGESTSISITRNRSGQLQAQQTANCSKADPNFEDQKQGQ